MPRRPLRIAPLLLALLVCASCGTPRYHIRSSRSWSGSWSGAHVAAVTVHVANLVRCVGECVCAIARIAAR